MSKATALAAAQAAVIPSTPSTPLQSTPESRTLVPTENIKIEPPVPTPTATPVTEPVVVVEPPKPNPDAERFAQLAKKEAALQKERESIKAERAKFEEVGKRFARFDELKAKDPVEAMKLAGFSDTDIFNFYVKAQENQKLKDTPEAKATAAVEAKLKEFETKLQAKEAEAKTTQDQAIIRKFQGKITQTVKADKDKYEFCNAYGVAAEQLIFATVENVLKDTGEVISTQEAADMVEKYYEDQDKSLSKLKKRGYTPPVEPQTTIEPIPTPSKTLSNKVTATVAATAPKTETREQKKERLVKQILEGGLRK